MTVWHGCCSRAVVANLNYVYIADAQELSKDRHSESDPTQGVLVTFSYEPRRRYGMLHLNRALY
jgi:hypothetical protein